MSSSLLLRVLLWMFPHSFSQRFGQEWLSLSEDLLENARSKGFTCMVHTWLGLWLDTLLQAPKAHAQVAWKAMVGTQPSLAGMGWSGRTLVLARHWGWRPFAAGAQGFYNHLFFVGTGALAMALSYYYFSFQAGWLVTDLTLQPADGQQALWSALLSWPCLGLAVFLVALVAGPHQAFQRWKKQGQRLLAPLWALTIGFFFTHHVFMAHDVAIITVQSAHLFQDYARNRDLPVAYPYADQQPWTTEQQRWFEINVDGDAVIRPTMLSAWCDVRGQILDQQVRTILLFPDSASSLRAILWKSSLAMAAQQGCYTPQQVLEKQTDLWNAMRPSPSPDQQVWSRYARFSPLANWSTISSYALQSRLLPQVLDYCMMEGQRQANLSRQAVDPVRLEGFCENLQTQLRPDQQPLLPPIAFLGLWGGVTETKQHFNELKPLTASDLGMIEAQLKAHQPQWQTLPSP